MCVCVWVACATGYVWLVNNLRHQFSPSTWFESLCFPFGYTRLGDLWASRSPLPLPPISPRSAGTTDMHYHTWLIWIFGISTQVLCSIFKLLCRPWGFKAHNCPLSLSSSSCQMYSGHWWFLCPLGSHIQPQKGPAPVILFLTGLKFPIVHLPHLDRVRPLSRSAFQSLQMAYADTRKFFQVPG